MQVARYSLVLVACVSTACASHPSTAGGTQGGGSLATGAPGGAGVPLRGTVNDMSQGEIQDGPTGPYRAVRPQPFQAASAWGRWRNSGNAYRGNIIVVIYDRPVSATEACSNDLPKGKLLVARRAEDKGGRLFARFGSWYGSHKHWLAL